MASRGDEGRDKLRKATGIGTYDVIRRYPNGATQQVEDLLLEREQTQRTETSKYLEEEKIIMISVVVANELERAQTNNVPALLGL